MGPTLFKKQFKKLSFCLRMIPVGGYCFFENFDKPGPNESVKSFNLKKILVLVMGPLFNLFLAIVLLLCANNVEGLKITQINDPQLSNTGIHAGHIIRNINGQRIFAEYEISDLLIEESNNTITILNENYEKQIIDFYCSDNELDISVDNSFGNKVSGTFRTLDMIVDIFRESVRDVFTGKESVVSDISNPYERVDYRASSIATSVNKFMIVTSVFALSLFILNLLPLLFFDGFKIIMCLISIAINKEITGKWLVAFYIIGVILTIILLL